MAQIHKCGVCGSEFKKEAEYLAHTCSETGHTPKEIAHLEASTQPEAGQIAEAAIARGEDRKSEKEHPASVAGKNG